MKQFHNSSKQESGKKKSAGDGKKIMADKNIKKLAVLIAVLLVVSIAICIVTYVQSQIDLQNYLTVNEVTGLNGQGEISYSLNINALSDALIAEGETGTEVKEGTMGSQELADYAIDCITLAASQETGLSNGDTVTVTAAFENTKKIKFPYHFKNAAIEYTVSGLREGEELNAFADGIVSLTFDGISGSGEAVLETQAPEDIYNYLQYELSENTDLINGDTVTVKVAFDAKQLDKMGYYAPAVTETSYTVEGLNEYLKLSDGIPEDTLTAMSQNLMNHMQGCVDHSLYAYNSIYNNLTRRPQIVGSYFVTTSDPSAICNNEAYDLNLQNAVIVLGRYTIQNTGFFSEVYDEWFARIVPNCYWDDEGNIAYGGNGKTIDLSTYSKDGFTSWFRSQFPGMTITELDN